VPEKRFDVPNEIEEEVVSPNSVPSSRTTELALDPVSFVHSIAVEEPLVTLIVSNEAKVALMLSAV
jgi:hypothetical protein